MVDSTILIGGAMVLAFVINIIVQITKNIIPMPTNLWCMIVSLVVNIAGLVGLHSMGKIIINGAVIVITVAGSFFTAFIAMYGFNTLKDLWSRFKEGENINEDSKNKKL